MTAQARQERMWKLEEYAQQMFSPAEYAKLCKLTENADDEVKDSYHYDLLVWACQNHIAETHGVRILHGVFNGIVHLIGVRDDGTPRFAIESGKRL